PNVAARTSSVAARTLLLQEPGVGVRSVNGDVTARAVAVARLDVVRRRDGVALVAELGHLLVLEQVAVHAAVRGVAADATLRDEPHVLEHEGTLEVAVALEAGAVVRSPEQRRAPAAVGLVAVEAGEHALWHLVMLGQREARSHLEMAAVAEGLQVALQPR